MNWKSSKCEYFVLKLWSICFYIYCVIFVLITSPFSLEPFISGELKTQMNGLYILLDYIFLLCVLELMFKMHILLFLTNVVCLYRHVPPLNGWMCYGVSHGLFKERKENKSYQTVHLYLTSAHGNKPTEHAQINELTATDQAYLIHYPSLRDSGANLINAKDRF